MCTSADYANLQSWTWSDRRSFERKRASWKILEKNFTSTENDVNRFTFFHSSNFPRHMFSHCCSSELIASGFLCLFFNFHSAPRRKNPAPEPPIMKINWLWLFRRAAKLAQLIQRSRRLRLCLKSLNLKLLTIERESFLRVKTFDRLLKIASRKRRQFREFPTVHAGNIFEIFCLPDASRALKCLIFN